ncbi:MAG TPA: class E sortase [Acidimicrobiales bacterium]|nr:class E sortase [Acidimicrobiales bacterium]
MRRSLAAAGRTLISAGVLLLLFVAYELWGTGISEARSQNSLAQQWQQTHHTRPHPGTTASTASTTTTSAPPPAVLPGFAIGRIQIPKVGVDKYFVEGVGEGDLKQGPGHYPGTPLPGQPGNASIAGHRTTYGAPFYNLNELVPGDKILIQTLTGTCAQRVCEYDVTQTPFPVLPSDVSVIAPQTGYGLTLTTCNPRFSAAQRLIIKATLAHPPATPPATTPAGPTKTPSTIPGDATVADTNTSGSSAAIPAVVGWGLGAGALWLLAWLVARRLKPRLPWGWPAYVGGAPVFLLLLYFFFENVTRLLPSNV